MQALDGNAIAGDLCEVFGAEMTNAAGVCTHCGSAALIAQLEVYVRAPGSVVRCRNCGSVVMVLINVRGTTRLEHQSFELREPVRARGE
jgi:DNA-directed RNA polymerase subunit RPC12/RpoP